MKSAIERNEFRKWLETMSVKASYSDQRELLRVVLKHYDDSLAQEKPAEPASHPSTAKSADRCGELVDRLRAHIKYQKESEADYLVYGEIEDILSEFSKDADKEGR